MRHVSKVAIETSATPARQGTLTTIRGTATRFFETGAERYLVRTDGVAKRVQKSFKEFVAAAPDSWARTYEIAFLVVNARFDLEVVR